jgi:glycosyltransferase involved in cell wall biosynthesis
LIHRGPNQVRRRPAARLPQAAVVIATRNRPAELRRLLRSLQDQTPRPGQVVVVDSSDQPERNLGREFQGLRLDYQHSRRRGAARQRNMGIKRVDRKIDLVGFVDDDAVLDRGALEQVRKFFMSAPPGIGGAALNLINHPDLDFRRLKASRLAKFLGAYSARPGTVSPSGFQTMIGSVDVDTFLDWLPSGAVFWRKGVLEKFEFDEWFEDYSYLEDLDLSYRVGKEYRLVVLSRAGHYHWPSASERLRGFKFGRKEVLNRLYFVRKNPEFSPGKAYLALFLRMLISLTFFLRRGDISFLYRSLGNVAGLWASLTTGVGNAR